MTTSTCSTKAVRVNGASATSTHVVPTEAQIKALASMGLPLRRILPPSRPHGPHPKRWAPEHFDIDTKDGLLTAEVIPPWDECDACRGGTLWTRDTRGYDFSMPCRCLIPRDRASLFIKAGLPEAARDSTLSEFDWSKIQRKAKRVIADLITCWEQGSNGGLCKGLILSGPTGVGKSHLAYGIAQWLTLGEGVRVRYVDWSTYWARVRNREHTDTLLRPLRAPHLLIVDDLNAATSWEQEAAQALIHQRVELDRKPMLITTNLRPEGGGAHSLRDALGDRSASRLLGRCEVLSIDGQDFRTAKRER